MLTLAGWASVSLIIIALVNLLILGALVYLVFMVRSQLQRLREKVDPVITEVQGVLGTVKETAGDVGRRVETISERAEHLAREVTGNVQRVSADVAQQVERVSASLAQKMDRVSSDLREAVEHARGVGERLTDRIAQRVDTTTSVIEEAVALPMVSLAGVSAGLRKSLEVWRELRKGDGQRRRREEAGQEAAQREAA